MKKRKITLIVAMMLSLSLFATSIAGLVTAVNAAEFEDEYIPDAEPVYDEPTDMPDVPSIPETYEEPVPEQPAEPQPPTVDPEEELRKQQEAQKQAEELQRQQEELQRQQEELQKQQEAEKQAALERAAQEAEELNKKQEADAAAEAAKKAAEEEAKKAAEEAEKARLEEEAKKKAAQEQDKSYGLRAMVDGGAISNVILTAAVGEGDFLVFNLINVGDNDVDLAYGISSASSDVFSLTLLSGSPALNVGSTDKFQIAVNPSAPAGRYSATLYFKDSKDVDDKYTKTINVNAEITNVPVVTKVSVVPQTIKVAPGGQCNFSALVQGRDGDVSQDVTWAISGMRSVGTAINENGVLTVGNEETATSFQVVATSVENPAISGVATVIVQANSYNVNSYPVPVNGGIVTGGGAVAQGGSVTLSAVPNKNFYFDGWYKDNKKVSTATNYTIDNVQTNLEIAAMFKQNYVTVTAIPNHEHAGSVVGGGKILYGGSTTLSAFAKDGYVFVGWKEGDETISTDSSIKLDNITVDRKIVAKFAKTRYNVSLSCNPVEGGSVSGGGTYKMNDNAQINAVPAAGYAFQYWTINGQIVSRDAQCTINTIDRDYSLTAVFIKQGVTTHTITAGVATTGGTISPSGVLVVPHDSSITYTMTPKSGFAILAVAVDGIQVGPVSSYTFTNIKGDHAIAVAFMQVEQPKPKTNDTDNTKKEPEATQQKKVQKVYKEKIVSDNQITVSENTVVDMKDAAAGTAGDEFVQEMDLTDVVIPTDEEIAAVQASNEIQTTNVLKRLGLSLDEMPNYISNGGSKNILESAFYEGYLDAYVDNQFAPPTDQPDYHDMSREELENLSDEYINPSLPNLDAVVESLLSPDEVSEIAKDSVAKFNISIKPADNTIDEKSKKVLNNAVGQKPLKYFDFTMVKVINGLPTNIRELTVPLKVVMAIPDDIYVEGREYSILRDHDGELTVLPDLDDNPKTITFQTDRFSSYAIAEKKATAKEIAINYSIAAMITLLIAVICLAMLIHHHSKFKKIHAVHEEITRKIREER